MVVRSIQFVVTTKSNLLIGGNPTTFEIGGIDIATLVDKDGCPYISASSFKGALKEIVKENGDDTVANYYREYLQAECDRNAVRVADFYRDDPEKLEGYSKSYEKAINNASAQYLFGIEGFNITPKLIFEDIQLTTASKSDGNYFSIDSKNTIENSEPNQIAAKPRVYKVARSGLKFEGSIRFRNITQLSGDAVVQVTDYLKKSLQHFNDGIYRLGNSKSRGYGWIEITFPQDEGPEE
jgi:CRISPR-associated protein Csm3